MSEASTFDDVSAQGIGNDASTAAEHSGQSYPLDIRLSVPFFGRRVFFVMLGGTERRSAERRRQERQKHRLWTFANVCAICFGLLFVVPAVIGLAHMLIAALNAH